MLIQFVVFVLAAVFSLRSPQGLELHNAAGEATTYRGRACVRLVEAGEKSKPSLAILPDSSFSDGVIEAEVAGKPRGDANETARGFVGIAFRVADASKFECFYIRPTNGRAEDQLRRNHSTQYVSHPDYPWFRLRKEHPGVYESYADLVTGEWTKLRIEVNGTKARLFVNGAAQPALIVNDLKLGPSTGKVALWIGEGTEAYFSKVTVTPSR